MDEPDVPPVPPVPGPPSWRERVDLLLAGRPAAARVAAGLVVAVVVLVAVLLVTRSRPGPPAELTLPVAGAPTEPAATSTTAATPTTVLAHAAGAVTAPGVYRLEAGARVADLVEAAGGAAAGADLDRLNLAAPLVDGQRIYLPMVGEAVPEPVGGDMGGGVPVGPLDLNTATADQLDELPGVGPATAAAILTERSRRGGFTSVDDLLDVPGIAEAKLEQMRDLVRV